MPSNIADTTRGRWPQEPRQQEFELTYKLTPTQNKVYAAWVKSYIEALSNSLAVTLIRTRQTLNWKQNAIT